MRITALQNNFQTLKPVRPETTAKTEINMDKISFAGRKLSGSKLTAMATAFVALLSHGKVHAEHLVEINKGLSSTCSKYVPVEKNGKTINHISLCKEKTTFRRFLETCIPDPYGDDMTCIYAELPPFPQFIPIPKPMSKGKSLTFPLQCGPKYVWSDAEGTNIKSICTDIPTSRLVLEDCRSDTFCGFTNAGFKTCVHTTPICTYTNLTIFE